MKSAFKSIWIPKERPANNILAKCVGCGVSVTPGACRTGSILGGLQHFTLNGEKVIPIYGEIECLGHVTQFVHRSESVITTKRVSFYKRLKGFLCEKCCANYKTVKDHNGSIHPIVKVDRNEAFLKPLEDRIYDPAKIADTSVCDVDTPRDAPIDVRAFRSFRFRDTKCTVKDKEVDADPRQAHKEHSGAFGSKYIGRK